MNKLEGFFDRIEENKEGILNVPTGAEFEKVISRYLVLSDFTEVDKEETLEVSEFLENNKENIQAKNGSNLLSNDTPEEDIFVYQPYGSQDYPDFVVFTRSMVYSLELKYTNAKKRVPMWNSNLPKKDGIYIFGSAGLKDISIFRGESILPDKERVILNEFFDQIKLLEEFEKRMKKEVEKEHLSFKHGLTPYIRTAFVHSKNINEEASLDYFDKELKKQNKKDLIEFLK